MNKNFKQVSIAYVIFLLLSVGSIVIFWRKGLLYGSGDLLFHLNRIVGLADGLNHHILPYRFFDVLTNIGSAANFFYPFVFFIGWAQLFNVFSNPVHAFYFGELLIQLATLIIAYHSVRLIKKDGHYQGIVFAILYGFSTYRFYLGYDQFVLGELLAYTFLPLAFAGFYNVVFGDYKKWLALPIGLSLVLYSHMVSIFLTLILFAVIFIGSLVYKNKNFEIARIVALGKSVILALLLTAIVYLPFLYQFRFRAIQTTQTPNIIREATLSQSINNALDMNFVNIGLLGLVACILVLVALFKKHYTMSTFVGSIGVVLFIISTAAFPWALVPKSFIAIIQFPYRLLDITTLLLMFFLSDVLVTTFKSKREITVMISIITVMVFGLFITKTVNVINARSNQPDLALNNLFYDNEVHFETKFKANGKQLNELKDSRHDYIGVMDYAPTVSWPIKNYYSIMTHDVLINNQVKHPHFSYHIDHVKGVMHLNKRAKVDLPFLFYGNETVKVNNKLVKANSTDRGTVGIKLPAGKSTIYVGYQTPDWIYLLWIFTVVSWIIVVIINIGIKLKKTGNTLRS